MVTGRRALRESVDERPSQESVELVQQLDSVLREHQTFEPRTAIQKMAPSDTQILRDEAQDEDLLPKPKEGAEEIKSKVELKKNLSLLNGIGLIVGTIIGAGIFISPAGVLGNTGSVGLSMCVWLACGVIASFGALCYCELGTAIPKAGGEYHYLFASFGPIPAFLFSWTAILVIKPSGIAGIAVVFGSYVTKPFYPDCDPPIHLVKLLGFSCIGKMFKNFFIRSFINFDKMVSKLYFSKHRGHVWDY